MLLTPLFRFLIAVSVVLMPVVGMAQLQVTLNANPLDPFPPSILELKKIAETNSSVQAALEAFQVGNLQKLNDSLLEARKANPEFPKMDVMRARIFMALGLWGDAYAILENHVGLNRTDAEAHKNFAEIAMVNGRWTDAWLQLEKAQALVDGMGFSSQRKQNFLAELLKMRAEVAMFRQDTPLATKLYEELIKSQPKDGSPLWNLGGVKLRDGDTAAGYELLKRGRQLDAKLPQPELEVASVLAVGKEREKADEWFRRGLVSKEYPPTEANWIAYLEYLLNTNRIQDARTLVDKAPEESKKSRPIRMIKGIIHRHLGENAEAEKIFSALHQENSDDVLAADHLALVLVESTDEGKRARAQQISEANVRLAPNVERTVATAAWVKFKTGSPDIAYRVIEEIIRGGRIEPQTAYYAAMMYKKRGMPENALNLLKFSLSGNASFPQRKSAEAEIAALEPKSPPETPKASETTSKSSPPAKK
jgi:tetratricopeptide (TPR) repeat protein